MAAILGIGLLIIGLLMFGGPLFAVLIVGAAVLASLIYRE